MTQANFLPAQIRVLHYIGRIDLFRSWGLLYELPYSSVFFCPSSAFRGLHSSAQGATCAQRQRVLPAVARIASGRRSHYRQGFRAPARCRHLHLPQRQRHVLRPGQRQSHGRGFSRRGPHPHHAAHAGGAAQSLHLHAHGAVRRGLRRSGAALHRFHRRRVAQGLHRRRPARRLLRESCARTANVSAPSRRGVAYRPGRHVLL